MRSPVPVTVTVTRSTLAVGVCILLAACIASAPTSSSAAPGSFLPTATPTDSFQEAPSDAPSASSGPTPEASASSAPSPTASASVSVVSPCRTSQLTVTPTNSSAAAGTVGVYLRFVNHGSQACELRGWPTVAGVTASGVATAARRDPVGYLPFPNLPIQTVRLRPGNDAFSSLSGSDVSGSGGTCPPSYHTLQVAPPGDSEHVALSAFVAWYNRDLPACAGLVVSPIVSSAQMDGYITYPLRP